MNCQDITQLLDDADIGALPAARLRTIEGHLASCQACARDWALHRRLVAMQIPPLAYDVAAVARGLTVAGVAGAAGARAGGRVGARRSRISYAGISVLSVAAAAAALLVVRPDALVRITGRAAPAASASLPVAASLPPTTAESSSSPTVAVNGPDPASVAPPATAMRPFTVHLEPLGNDATDPLGHAAIETFYAALLSELRAIPGLSLTVSATASPRDAEQFDYELAGRGRNTGSGNTMRVLMRVKRSGPNAVALPIAADFEPGCPGVADGELAHCFHPVSAAAGMVNSMRKMVFPMDGSQQRRLEAQLADPALDPAERFERLRELARASGGLPRVAGPNQFAEHALVSDAAVAGTVSLVAVSTPEQRAAIWQLALGSRNPSLIEPLVSAMQFEPDRMARKEALLVLTTDFPADPRVRQQLELSARQDEDPMIRALADRAISGEGNWVDYVSSSLRDASRPAAERVEALIHHLRGVQPTATRGESDIGRVLDDAGIASLAQVLPSALASSAGQQVSSVIVSRLGGVNSSAVTDALLEAVESGLPWSQRSNVLSQLVNRSADPRVRASLTRIATTDPDAQARAVAARAVEPQRVEPRR